MNSLLHINHGYSDLRALPDLNLIKFMKHKLWEKQQEFTTGKLE